MGNGRHEDLDVICDIPGVTTFDGIFNGEDTDGTWTFQTFDLHTYSPGSYTVTIEAVTGINSFQTAQSTFELIFQNPCWLASITLNYKPFEGRSMQVRDDQDI